MLCDSRSPLLAKDFGGYSSFETHMSSEAIWKIQGIWTDKKKSYRQNTSYK